MIQLYLSKLQKFPNLEQQLVKKIKKLTSRPNKIFQKYSYINIHVIISNHSNLTIFNYIHLQKILEISKYS